MNEEKLYKLYKQFDKNELIRLAAGNKIRAENSRKELEKTINRNKKTVGELQGIINKAKNKLDSMFSNGYEETILEDLLELDKILGSDKE